MAKKIKVAVSGNRNYYFTFLNTDYFERVNKKLEADILILTGGLDVSPHLYGEKDGYFTNSSKHRDMEDTADFKLAQSEGIMLIGVCRGAQFITVKSGGKLFQDVTGHLIPGTHSLTIDDEYLQMVDDDIVKAIQHQLVMTSTHHQMMNPYVIEDKSKYEIIGYSEKTLSSWYLGEDNTPYLDVYNDKDFVEPEIVWYPEVGLAIQGHPERLPNDSATVKFLNNLVMKKYSEFESTLKNK
jgi:gamma-glutamyl-gamma-aminobutyrate hydrolase PuuD